MIKNYIKNLLKDVLSKELETARQVFKSKINDDIIDFADKIADLNRNINTMRDTVNSIRYGGSGVHSFLGYPSNRGMIDDVVNKVSNTVYEKSVQNMDTVINHRLDSLGISSERFIDKVVERIKNKQL